MAPLDQAQSFDGHEQIALISFEFRMVAMPMMGGHTLGLKIRRGRHRGQ